MGKNRRKKGGRKKGGEENFSPEIEPRTLTYSLKLFSYIITGRLVVHMHVV